jgi:hypothetical protein
LHGGRFFVGYVFQGTKGRQAPASRVEDGYLPCFDDQRSFIPTA